MTAMTTALARPAFAPTPLRNRIAAIDPSIAAGLVLGALVLGAAVVTQPLLVVAGALGLGAIAMFAFRPVWGVYALVVVTPLTAGIDRGTLIPGFRPNEALCGLIAAGLIARWLVQVKSTRNLHWHIDPILASLLALAILDSVVPLLWLRLRGEAIGSDDLLYSLVLWKFLVVFLIVRAAHLTDTQIWRLLQVSVAAAVVVSVISMLQTAGWGPVISLLKGYYTTNDNTNAITNARGSSTLGLPIAAADLATFNLAIVMGMIWLRGRAKPGLVIIGWVLTLGVVGAGEVSGLIGLIIGIATVCVVTRSGFAARFLLLGGTIGLPFVWTVIQTRLAGFQSLSGLPISWTGRLNNLHTYFWPVLFSDHRYLLGVRPAARVVVSNRANGYVWIESGYTWLLWAGGIPLLLAFVWFVVVAVRAGRRALHSGSDPMRIVGLTTIVAVTVIVALMVFDPHLTYRGVADELFTLLALCAASAGQRKKGIVHG